MHKLIILLFPLWLIAYEIFTEENPPLSYIDKDNTIKGVAVDIVRAMLKELNYKDNIKIQPWARSYKLIQQKPNVALFAMSRFADREKLFKWVGPIIYGGMALYAKKGSNIKISSLEDAKSKNLIIGTYKDDIGEIYLKKMGFKNLESVHDDNLNIKKLIKGRIDLWSAGVFQGIEKAKKLNLDNQIKNVFIINQSALYIAFSKDTSQKEIQKWQNALLKIQIDGTYQTILKEYNR